MPILSASSAGYLARQSAKAAADTAYQVSRMKRLPGIASGLSDVLKRNAYIQGKVAKPLRTVQKSVETTNKTVKGVKQITDYLKSGKFTSVHKHLGSAGALGAALGSAVISFMVIDAQGKIQEAQLNKDAVVQKELDLFTRVNSRLNARLKSAEKKIESLTNRVINGIDRVYAETGSAIRNSTIARQSANDALYEVRRGRVSLEGLIQSSVNSVIGEVKGVIKLANDALYETRQGRVQLDQKISQNKVGLNNQINQLKAQLNQITNTTSKGLDASLQATIANLKTGIAEAKAEANKSRDYATAISKTLQTTQTVIDALKTGLKTANDKAANATDEAKKAFDIARKYIETAQSKQQADISKIVADKVGTAIKGIDSVAKRADDAYKLAEKTANQEDIKGIARDLSRINNELNFTNRELNKVKGEVEADKIMDAKANEKLEKLIGNVAMIPPLIRSVGSDVKQSIPTQEQMATAAATGTCRTTQPGGCSRKMVEDVVGNNANNINANTNDKFGQLNAALNGFDLALLKTIDTKLGGQLPGGMSSFLQRLSQNAVLDRLLNVLTFMTTLHNAHMLSANLGQSLLSLIDNALRLFGIQDSEGNSYSIGDVIGKSADGMMKQLLGETEWGTVKREWAKLNRIYQATANIISAFQSISQSILSALEVIGGWNAKVGNALRQWGVVAENAYNWFNPQPNFKNKILIALETGENVVSQIDQVAGEILSVQDSIKQIAEQQKELNAAMSQADGSKQGNDSPEAQKTKEEAVASTVASAGATISQSSERKPNS